MIRKSRLVFQNFNGVVLDKILTTEETLFGRFFVPIHCVISSIEVHLQHHDVNFLEQFETM